MTKTVGDRAAPNIIGRRTGTDADSQLSKGPERATANPVSIQSHRIHLTVAMKPRRIPRITLNTMTKSHTHHMRTITTHSSTTKPNRRSHCNLPCRLRMARSRTSLSCLVARVVDVFSCRISLSASVEASRTRCSSDRVTKLSRSSSSSFRGTQTRSENRSIDNWMDRLVC